VPEIKVDRLAILRVLRNLVDNALKYGGDELSEITIGYEGSDEHHILSVCDDGVAIKSEDSQKIFGPFQRHETSRGVKGTGLGLSIVKEIAEQHGGKVWMKSGEDKGITFYLTISKRL
jgi:signal transduction histidine kinase